jgi:Lon protease-like protein
MLRDHPDGFGVVLIREGPEVGGPTEPFAVGTMARVEERREHEGMTYLLARGTKRFRIAATHRERPYLEGDVEWLPEPEAEPGHGHAHEGAHAHPHGPTLGHGHHHLPVELEVAALFDEYVHLLLRITRVPVDEDVEALLSGQRRASPWAMACAIGGAMLVAAPEKQPILEAASVHDALHLEQDLLARENARLRALARQVDARNN